MNYSLVAVSGGSDSMALLDKLRLKGLNLIVCHINYGFRDSALRDENIVRDYCKKYNLKLEVLNNIKYNKEDGNLENFARVIRYNFFKENYKKYNCDYLYVGHNLDDLLETYFIQKRRRSKCDFYGILEENFMYEMKVKRILLNETKKELKEYCENNKITYGVDETNFDESYLRNEIRSQVISKMSKEEKLKILEEIKELNKGKREEYERIHKLLSDVRNSFDVINISKLVKLNSEDKKSLIYYFIIENVKERVDITSSRLNDIVRKIESNKPNIELAKFKDLFLIKEYSELVMVSKKKDYKYIINDLKNDIKEFEIADVGNKLEKVIVMKNSFPLVIENYKGDNPLINRLFIEKKIPFRKREDWPIVKDKLGNVLLVLNLKKFYNIEDFVGKEFIEFYIKRKEEGDFSE